MVLLIQIATQKPYNFVPINDDSSKTIKFVLDLLSEAVIDGQDSARKQGLVQKLDGDKGPKVFLNTTTKKVSVKSAEETDEKEAEVILSQEPMCKVKILLRLIKKQKLKKKLQKLLNLRLQNSLKLSLKKKQKS